MAEETKKLPNLGLATTAELIDELAARFRMSALGPTWDKWSPNISRMEKMNAIKAELSEEELSYSTVGGADD